jgi:hypothetical protein
VLLGLKAGHLDMRFMFYGDKEERKMKPISLKMQKILMLLPVLNYLNWFVLYYNEICLKLPRREVSRAMIAAICCMLALMIPRGFWNDNSTYMYIFGIFLGNYIAPMLASYILIRCQNKLGVQ